MRLLKVFLFLMVVTGCAMGQTASVTLNWTAVGDDSLSGCATTYDLRWSTDSTALVTNWAGQNKVLLVPPPQCVGALEYFTVTGLPSGTTVFFAVKVLDERLNMSGISNIVRYQTNDMIPPAAVTDLRVQ